MKFVIKDTVRGIGTVTPMKVQQDYLNSAITVIQGMNELCDILMGNYNKEEQESSGMSEEDYILTAVDGIVNSWVTENVIADVKSTLKLGVVGVNETGFKLNNGLLNIEVAHTKLSDVADNFIYMSTDEMIDIAKTIKTGLGDFIYYTCFNYGIFKTVHGIHTGSDEVELESSVKATLAETGLTLEFLVELEQMVDKYPPVLEIFEEHVEEWQEFVNSLDRDYKYQILDLAEYIKLSDIVDIREGKVLPDMELVDMLETRKKLEELNKAN